MDLLLRWCPALLPAAFLTFARLYPWEGSEYATHHGASLFFPKVWLVVAVWVAVTRRHRVLATNLREMPAGAVAAALGTVTALVVLARVSYASPSWVPLFLLCLHISLSGEFPRMRFAALSAGLVVSAMTVEGFVHVVRRVPSEELPAELSSIHAALYQKDWRIIQFDEECSRYDPELLYTLRPGACEFSNAEFSTTVHVNELGVRDDRESLEAPVVIVTGDSHAMGWGVEQHETFAHRLEQMTGQTVLNTAVSSYATARQLSMVERVDRSRLRYLLIQHCANDFLENSAFAEQGELPEPSRELYDTQVAESEQSRRYYPGRYVTWFLSNAASTVLRRFGFAPSAPSPPAALDPRDEVENLLDVLENHPVDLSGIDIVLFEINEDAGYREWLVPTVREALAEREGRRHMDRVQAVEVGALFEEEDFYPIDGHMTASAHRKLASHLAGFIE